MRFSRAVCVSLIMGVAGLPSSAAARPEPQPVPLTPPQLIQSIEAARGRISDFSVSFRFDVDAAPANLLFARSHRTVYLKDRRVRIDHEYAAMPEYNGPTYIVRAAFDGAIYTTHLEHLRQANRSVRGSSSVDTKGAGFFDIMMWNPAATGQGSGYSDQDLLSVLRSPQSTLRPNLEDIDGHTCIVVDEREAGTGAIAFTAWIDIGRGMIPIRQRFIDLGSGGPVMEFFIDAAHEASPGLWFPTAGRKINYALTGVPELSQLRQYTLAVDTDATGNPVLAVNAGIADSVFNVLTSLPLGTRVGDIDTGERWTIAATDSERPGASSATQIAGAPRPAPDANQHGSPGFTQASQVTTSRVDSSPLVFVFAAAGIAAVAALGFVGLRVRRARA